MVSHISELLRLGSEVSDHSDVNAVLAIDPPLFWCPTEAIRCLSVAQVTT